MTAHSTWHRWGRRGFSDYTIPEFFLRIINEYDGENALKVMQGMEKDGMLLRIGKGCARTGARRSTPCMHTENQLVFGAPLARWLACAVHHVSDNPTRRGVGA